MRTAHLNFNSWFGFCNPKLGLYNPRRGLYNPRLELYNPKRGFEFYSAIRQVYVGDLLSFGADIAKFYWAIFWGNMGNGGHYLRNSSYLRRRKSINE